MKLLPPTSYQGGKQRIASKILDIINPDFNQYFYDLCCGSGAISIELVNRGLAPNQIVMLDKGSWGAFWRKIGNGFFDLDVFRSYLDRIPKDVALIQDYVKELSKQPPDQNTIYTFLILQASSFGGKSIWIDGNRWKNCSFRSYWMPTATSNRRSSVNPMMPMPSTLFERVRMICEKMNGITGICDDIMNFKPSHGVVYSN